MMNNFIILHTKDHSIFKDFIKKKPGSLNISYIDMLNHQEKYLLFGESKNNSVLECELFNKIYESLSNLHNPKYHTIFYYTDTLDYVIIEDFTNTIINYKNKLEIDLDILICNLDDTNIQPEKCLQYQKKGININQTNKEYIQQIF